MEPSEGQDRKQCSILGRDLYTNACQRPWSPGVCRSKAAQERETPAHRIVISRAGSEVREVVGSLRSVWNPCRGPGACEPCDWAPIRQTSWPQAALADIGRRIAGVAASGGALRRARRLNESAHWSFVSGGRLAACPSGRRRSKTAPPLVARGPGPEAGGDAGLDSPLFLGHQHGVRK